MITAIAASTAAEGSASDEAGVEADQQHPTTDAR